MDDTTLKSGHSANTLGGLELNYIPAAFTLFVDLKIGANVVPRVLLGVKLCWGLALPPSEGDLVANFATLWWCDNLNHSSVSVFSAEDHAVGFVSCKFLSLQVAEDNAHGLIHFLNWHKFLKTRCNLADFTISDVDFLTVELDGVGVLPDLNNFTDADVHLTDIRNNLSDDFGWLGLLGGLGFLLGFSFGRGRGLLGLFGLLILSVFGSVFWSVLGLLSVFGSVFWSVLGLFLSTSLCRSTTCLLGILFCLNFSKFSELFKLGLRRSLSILIRESNKDLFGLGLLKHAGQVLDVVNPSKNVRQVHLLVIGQQAELLSNVCEYNNVSRCDREAAKEHSGLADVRVDRLDKLISRKTLCLLDE